MYSVYILQYKHHIYALRARILIELNATTTTTKNIEMNELVL